MLIPSNKQTSSTHQQHLCLSLNCVCLRRVLHSSGEGEVQAELGMKPFVYHTPTSDLWKNLEYHLI